MKNRTYKNRMLFMLGASLLATVIFSACNKDDDNYPEPVSAGLMSFNLAKDQPAVGFAISGNVLTNTPLGYNNFTGTYQRIFTGNRSVAAYIFGTQNTIATTETNFEADKYYSVFLVGSSTNYTNLLTRDNFDSLKSNNGKAYIRYLNAIPDSAAMQVTVAQGGGNVVNDAAPFKTISEFVAVNPGNINIALAVTGIAVPITREIEVAENKVYTILLSEKPEYLDPLKPKEIKYIENGVLSN